MKKVKIKIKNYEKIFADNNYCDSGSGYSDYWFFLSENLERKIRGNWNRRKKFNGNS